MRHLRLSWAQFCAILISISLSWPGVLEARKNSQWIASKTSSKSQKMYSQKPQKTFVGKTASLIIDAATGRVLHQHNADEIRYPASLTKMMTMYLVFEALEKGTVTLRDTIPVSKNAAGKCPMKLGLKPGDRIRIDDAIRGSCIKSANDAATALAEALAGSEQAFGDKMTQKAKKLGMSKTVFKNPSGLPDPDQVSTARDMATLSQALFRDYPQYCFFFAEKSFQYRGVTYRNHNTLLHSMPLVDGIKTGYTPNAGHNYATSVRKNGRRIIAVLLGAESRGARNGYMKKMLDLALSKIAHVKEEIETIIHPPVKPSRISLMKKPAAPLSAGEAETMEELLNTILEAEDLELEDVGGPELDEEEIAMTLAQTSCAMPKIDPTEKPRPGVKPIALRLAAAEEPLQAGPQKGKLEKWAIQVGAFPNKKSAEEHAAKLQKKHESLLGGLKWIVSSEKAKGKMHHKTRFTLPNKDDAKKIAAALKEGNQDSFVVELT